MHTKVFLLTQEINGFPFSSLGIMCAIASLLVLPIIFVLVKGKALSNKKKMTI